MSLLTVENLYITYEKTEDAASRFLNPLVDNLNFTIEIGEIVGLIGPSGCGKTSVAWTIMGMIEEMQGYAKGKITFQGQPLFHDCYRNPESFWWKEMAIVPQASMSSFNPGLTIRQVIKETILAHEKPKGDLEVRCKKLMQMVQLDEDVLNYYPHEMSGGMKQRAAISIAMVFNPALLILDEATTGLDVLVEADILETIQTIQEQEQMSILLISHDRRISNTLCHKILDLGGEKDE